MNRKLKVVYTVELETDGDRYLYPFVLKAIDAAALDNASDHWANGMTQTYKFEDAEGPIDVHVTRTFSNEYTR